MNGGITWTEYWHLPASTREILIDLIQDEVEERKLALAKARVKGR